MAVAGMAIVLKVTETKVMANLLKVVATVQDIIAKAAISPVKMAVHAVQE